MSQPRTIKKYPNRRLYDTEESRYITLADIRRLVREEVEFAVIDKRSQADITHSILLQVIAEAEQEAPVLSRDFLTDVIRAYGGDLQEIVGSYLEQSMKLFTSQRQQIRDRMRAVAGQDVAAQSLAQQNYARWRSVQDEIFRALSGSRGRDRRESENLAEKENP
jgi:polyhydroxyalkanoate synthesis repressor PhaR